MAIHRGIKLRHIRAFLALASEGTVSGAAQRLGMSQPSLSKTLSELQEMLGVTLIERAGRGVTLTAAGVTFQRHAIQSIRQLEAGASAISAVGAVGDLHVGCLPTAAAGVFPEAALRLSAESPRTTISVMTGPNAFLLERLQAGKLDLVVGRMPPSDRMPGLRFDWLYDEDVVLVARPGHPLTGADVAAALKGSRLILPPRKAIIRPRVDDYLTAMGVDAPDVAFETVSLALALRLLERSDMLWFISRGVVARELAEGTLVSLPLDAPFLSGAVGITLKPEPAPRPAVARLVEALHEAAREASANP